MLDPAAVGAENEGAVRGAVTGAGTPNPVPEALK